MRYIDIQKILENIEDIEVELEWSKNRALKHINGDFTSGNTLASYEANIDAYGGYVYKKIREPLTYRIVFKIDFFDLRSGEKIYIDMSIAKIILDKIRKNIVFI